MTYNYLFKHVNCDHGEQSYSYQPFTTTKRLTQEDADIMMLKHNPSAGRIGSTIDDLCIVACDEGYEMNKFNCKYKLNSDLDNSYLDPLPASFHLWPIIQSIMGNY